MIEILPPRLVEMLTSVPELRHTNLVGGAVRDYVMAKHAGVPLRREDYNDLDLEVFNTTPERLVEVLSPWGRIDAVGKAFGVLKLTTPEGETFDFAQPRADKKTGDGHKGFSVDIDPFMSPERAALRRDYTINSMAFNVFSQTLLDFHGGERDLKAGILRHTSEAFSEDELRPLRGLQFCGRFGLTATPETAELCRNMLEGYANLPESRIREEWIKWAAQSKEPSKGLQFLEESGWISLYPALDKMRTDCPQDVIYHPEGKDRRTGKSRPDSGWIHTKHCCDFMANNPDWKKLPEDDRLVYMMAILTHDLAKPSCTEEVVKDGVLRITSHGHEEASGPMAREFCRDTHMPDFVGSRVQPLVEDHLAYMNPPTKRSVGRLARRVYPDNIQGLYLVWQADQGGRPPLPPTLDDNAVQYLAMATDLKVEAKPAEKLIQGRDLMALDGMTPGPALGEAVKRIYEAQTDGLISTKDEALAWWRENRNAPAAPAPLPAEPGISSSNEQSGGVCIT